MILLQFILKSTGKTVLKTKDNYGINFRNMRAIVNTPFDINTRHYTICGTVRRSINGAPAIKIYLK